MVRGSHTSRRTYLKGVGGTVAGIAVTGCLSSGGSQGLTAGTAPGFPPFEMKQSGELVGFDVDLLEAVVEESDRELAGWKEFEFDSLIPALKNGNVDVVAAGMTVNDKRDQVIDFTDPYYSSDQAIVVRGDGEFSPGNFDEMSEHPVGAQKGTTGESVVKEQLVEQGIIAKDQFNAYGNYVLAIEDLENGNVDAVVIDEPVAASFSASRPVETTFRHETGERFGFGIQEGSAGLSSSLNDGLAAVRESGTYRELTAKWFGQES